jgi:hypothetical protein
LADVRRKADGPAAVGVKFSEDDTPFNRGGEDVDDDDDDAPFPVVGPVMLDNEENDQEVLSAVSAVASGSSCDG